MRRDDVRKLLGGYATGNLSGEERRRLLEASLDDPAIFEALAEEEALRDLIADPGVRSRLSRALEAAPVIPWYRRRLVWAASGSMAAALAITAVVWQSTAPPLDRPATVAMTRPPAAPALPPAAPPEARPTARRRDQTKPARTPDLPAEQRVARSEATAPVPRPSPAPPAGSLRVSNLSAGPQRVASRPAGQETAFLAAGDVSVPLRHFVEQSLPGGRWRQAPPDAPLRIGEEVRIVFIPSSNGELQVRERDREGVWRPLLPPGFRVLAGTPCIIPSDGVLRIDVPGTKRFEAVFTPDGGPPFTLPVTL